MTANEQLLSLEVRETGERVVVAAAGELDPHSCSELSDALEPYVNDEAVQHIVIDLGGITFIDSSGLRVVLSTKESLEERGATLGLATPSESVQRILDITGLSQLLSIEDL